MPAAAAVNYAVVTVRQGTISTAQPLAPTTLQQSFAPEDPWTRARRERIMLALGTTSLTAAGAVWAFFMHRRPRILVVVGGVWLTIGSVWLVQERPMAPAFLLVGVICLLGGVLLLFRAQGAPEKSAG